MGLSCLRPPKNKIRKFHAVVVRWQQEMYRKVWCLHVQICCFAHQTFKLFQRFRCCFLRSCFKSLIGYLRTYHNWFVKVFSQFQMAGESPLASGLIMDVLFLILMLLPCWITTVRFPWKVADMYRTQAFFEVKQSFAACRIHIQCNYQIVPS